MAKSKKCSPAESFGDDAQVGEWLRKDQVNGHTYNYQINHLEEESKFRRRPFRERGQEIPNFLYLLDMF
jgi:hypothetical protein